ncbi:MAG: NAD(P)(+) transhydrogenase (Re/Si-specific) subunit beta [Planctomycetes bacterium]|nr:NAD(P)(+) transhydrogenase (Re/Si-specific) subunit beta [Planctomycetota bacterium]
MHLNHLLANFGYLVSVVMFMLAIMRMGRVKTARSGNFLAALAMLLAVVSSFVEMGQIEPWFIVGGLVVGGAVGAIMAKKVQMTQMPEMVALLNGFGGLASTFVGLATFFSLGGSGTLGQMMKEGGWFGGMNLVLTLIVGSVTFTGSVIAFLKLSEKMSGRPILLPGRHALNGILLLAPLALGVGAVWFVQGVPLIAAVLILIVLLTFVLGVTIVIPIGGGDMPVVISLLNSYSGIAAALAGFTINEPVLVVSGSLVGASGLILTQIMCKAMNRSLANVMFGGFGAEPAAGGGGGGGEYVGVKSSDPESVAMILADAANIVIVPGYGMAVAQAQHAVREMANILEEKGATIRYAVHPVAGRMPGHMNVLLAEANVPYEQLFEMDQINDDFRNVDVVMVIGANDTVNPAAKTDKSSPLYGMPVMNVEDAKTVFTMKRSLGSGFAQVKNTLFECPNNYMVFGDARKTLEEIIKALKED